MNTDFKNLKKEIEKNVKDFEKTTKLPLEDKVLNDYAPYLHNMKQEEVSGIIDEVFCDPDLKSLINYEKELYGANRD